MFKCSSERRVFVRGGVAAAVSVFDSAFFATALVAKLTGTALGGVIAGAVFTAVLVLLSACANDDAAHSLPLFASAAAALTSACRKPNVNL